MLTPTMVSGAVADAGGWWHQWWLAQVGVRGGGLVGSMAVIGDGGNCGVGLQ